MFQIMYSNPGAGAITPSRATRSSHESSARDHPSLALPRKDSVQISHARDPALLYLHCEREGETEKTINKICDMLEQCVARGMNPLRMKQVCSVNKICVCNLMYGRSQWNHKLLFTFLLISYTKSPKLIFPDLFT